MEKLSMQILEIGNMPFRVVELEHGYKNGFRKNNAYIIRSDLENVVYPYRGELKSFKKLFEPDNGLEPGIYSLEGRVPTKIQIYRATGKDAEQYSLDRIINLDGGDLVVKPDDMIKVKMNVSGGPVWMPELRDDDDATSSILKTAIQLKRIVFADYSPRLEESAVGLGQGSKGVSAKSNSKRAIENNRRTSMDKFMYYTDTFDLDVVIGVKDKPGARDPMFPDGKPLVLFASGEQFDLNDFVTEEEAKQMLAERNALMDESEDD